MGVPAAGDSGWSAARLHEPTASSRAAAVAFRIIVLLVASRRQDFTAARGGGCAASWLLVALAHVATNFDAGFALHRNSGCRWRV